MKKTEKNISINITRKPYFFMRKIKEKMTSIKCKTIRTTLFFQAHSYFQKSYLQPSFDGLVYVRVLNDN